MLFFSYPSPFPDKRKTALKRLGELRKPYLAMILLTFKAVRGTTFEHTSKAPRTDESDSGIKARVFTKNTDYGASLRRPDKELSHGSAPAQALFARNNSARTFFRIPEKLEKGKQRNNKRLRTRQSRLPHLIDKKITPSANAYR